MDELEREHEKVPTTRIRKQENLKSNLSLLIISNDQCQRDHFSGPSSDINILFIVNATVLNLMVDYAEFFLLLLLPLFFSSLSGSGWLAGCCWLLLTLRSFDVQIPKRFHFAAGNLKPFALSRLIESLLRQSIIINRLCKRTKLSLFLREKK